MARVITIDRSPGLLDGLRGTSARYAMAEVFGAVRPALLLVTVGGLAAIVTLPRAGAGVALSALWVTLLGTLVMLLPGLVVLRVLRWNRGLGSFEQLPRAFVLSSLLGLLIGSVTLTLRANIVWAGVLLLGFCLAGLAWCAVRASPDTAEAIEGEDSTGLWLMVGLWGVLAVVGSLAGAPVTGEEEVELVTIRKLAESAAPGWGSIMHRPDVWTTYLLTPQYLMEALVARFSLNELIGVYVKLRLVYVFVAGAGIFAVARVALGSIRGAVLACLIGGILVVVDPDPFSLMASLFPLARRGAVAAGVLLPAVLAMAFDALQHGGRARTVAVALAAVVLLMTHATEGAHFIIILAGGLLLGVLYIRRDPVFWRRTLVVLAAALLCGESFRVFQSQAAQHVTDYEAPRQATLLQALSERLTDPLQAVTGSLEPAGSYVFGAALPVLPYPAFAVVVGAMALVFGGTRFLGWIWIALGLALLIFLIPAASLLAMYLTTTELYFIFGALTLLSVPLLASFPDQVVNRIHARLFHIVPRFVELVSLVLVGILLVVPAKEPVQAIVMYIGAAPRSIFGAAIAALLLCAAGHRLLRPSRRVKAAPLSVAVVGTLTLFVPLSLAVKSIPAQLSGSHREDLGEYVTQAWLAPDPLDFQKYNSTLPHALPIDVVQWLRTSVPMQQVVLFRPDLIYSLPVYANLYIPHPGNELSTDTEYFEQWVPEAGGHPYFTASPDDERDRRFLAAYGVNYILVDAEFQSTLGSRLAADTRHFRMASHLSTYSLFQVVPTANTGQQNG